MAGVAAGQLIFFTRLFDTWVAVASDTPYDPVAHRWWRFRADAGVLYWETAPDAVTWTTWASVPTPFPLDAVFVHFGAGTDTAVATTATASFAHYNLPP